MPRQLYQGGSLPPIRIIVISGRKQVRDGAHRVRAVLEYSEENNLIPEIEYVLDPGPPHYLYPRVCDRLFGTYGVGISAFKAIALK